MKQYAFLVAAVFLISFIGYSANASALGLSYYGVEDEISEDFSVHNKITLQFDSPVTHLDYQLDFRINNLTAKADFISAECEVDESGRKSTISCDFVGMTEEDSTLVLEFDIDNVIKEKDGKFQFVVNYGVSLPIERVFAIIALPKNGILSEIVANESYFPRDGSIITDGRHIIVFWEDYNLTSGDNLQYSISYATPGKNNPLFNMMIIGITIIVIIAIIGIALFVRRTPATKEIIAPLLKKDEKTIVDIINKNDGACIQRILVRGSNFSKAKVSRLVKSLNERGVVEVDHIGRTTKVKLKLKGTES